MTENKREVMSDKIIEQQLNNLGNKIQEVVIDGEMLVPSREDSFSAEFKNYKKEMKY